MNFPHIVFLDFDGPLFPEKILLIPENNSDNEILKDLGLSPLVNYWKADPSIIAMLNSLYELRSYFIVITSIWADYHEKEQIESLLAINGLNITLHEDWKLNNSQDSKGHKIKDWLSRHKIADYMILDDDESGEDFSNNNYLEKCKLNKHKIVTVSMEDGVSMSNFYKMKSIIANWD